eukprot:SAG22_NODE_1349_length_4655_cov_6.900132_4_plen_85_part_00
MPWLHCTALHCTALQGTPARIDRIHVTGHSRGGHGALMVGLNQPDRCMTMSSLSGWYKREYYGDANPLFVADIQLSHLEPGLKR